jgi:hypothetical protein
MIEEVSAWRIKMGVELKTIAEAKLMQPAVAKQRGSLSIHPLR